MLNLYHLSYLESQAGSPTSAEFVQFTRLTEHHQVENHLLLLLGP